MCIDDLNRGDKIRIKVLDDTFLNINYRNREGVIEKIDYNNECIYGTWGTVELYPEYDELEIIEKYEQN